MKALGLLCLIACSFPAAMTAQTVLYSNNFSGTAGNTAFPSLIGTWGVAGGTFNNTTTSPTQSSAAVSVAGVSAQSFTLSSQFTINSFTTPNTGTGYTVGFGILSSTSFFASGTYYLADFTFANANSAITDGQLRIVSPGLTSGGGALTGTTTGVANDNGGSATTAIQTGTTYTLKLTGTYDVGGALQLTFGLYDATGTVQIGTSATASAATPLSGTYFGYRDSTASSTLPAGPSSISLDNFAIATAPVPEPSSAALILGGLSFVALAGRRSLTALLR